MFEEVLKIKPKIDNSTLTDMERRLNGRFNNVAKRFGAGLKTTVGSFIKGTLIAGAVSAIAAILNPIREVEGAIERMLGKADNIATRAKQFGTSIGRYYMMQQLAQASDLDASVLDMMIGKFQVELEKARQTGEGPLKDFVGEKDVVGAMYRYIQGAQKLSPDERALAYSQVLGERQIGKAAEFLATDPTETLKKLGLTEKRLDAQARAVLKVSQIQDYKALTDTKRDADQMVTLSQRMSREQIDKMDAALRKKEIERLDKQFKSYDDIKTVANATQGILNLLSDVPVNIIKVLRETKEVFQGTHKLQTGTNKRLERGDK